MAAQLTTTGGLSLAEFLAQCIQGLKRSKRDWESVIAISSRTDASDQTRGYEANLASATAALIEARRLHAIAEQITITDDESQAVSLLNETRSIIATPDDSRSYGLRWSVEGAEPEDAEYDALLDLAACWRCYQLQNERPSL